MYDIIIPSCKEFTRLSMQARLIANVDKDKFNYISTGFNASASINRNYGLHQAFKTKNEFIIMIDDDIGGFYRGWQDDLVKPLKEDNNVIIASARLITPEGNLSSMMGTDFNLDCEYSNVEVAILSAAIAFRKRDMIENDELRFNMNMIGSGYEDTLFCRLMTLFNPESHFLVVNKCKLIHYHEMKNQQENLQYNHSIYLQELQKRGIHE